MEAEKKPGTGFGQMMPLKSGWSKETSASSEWSIG
jgi:hypothetical protein